MLVVLTGLSAAQESVGQRLSVQNNYRVRIIEDFCRLF
jgi:hypothetical protein